MPRNGSGVYTLPAGNPVTSGTLITVTWGNGTMSDLAAEMTNSLDRSGRGPMLAAFKSTDGTVAAPGISFNSEAGSGLYRVSGGVLGFSVGGVEVSRWNGTTLSLSQLGSAVTPTLQWVGSTAGLYASASALLASVGGTLQMTVAAAGITAAGLLYGRGGGAGLGQITVSTSAPSGGADGDLWIQY